MNEHQQKMKEDYLHLPQSFRGFAAIAYQTLTGWNLEDSRARRMKFYSKCFSDKTDADMREFLQRFIDSSEEDYEEQRMRFTLRLDHLCCHICISKKLCLTVAEWLNKQKKISFDDFEAVIKALSYLCGTEENRAIEFLSTATFEQLRDAFIETIDYLDDDLLVPWVSDEIKAEHRIWEENETPDEQCDE